MVETHDHLNHRTIRRNGQYWEVLRFDGDREISQGRYPTLSFAKNMAAKSIIRFIEENKVEIPNR